MKFKNVDVHKEFFQLPTGMQCSILFQRMKYFALSDDELAGVLNQFSLASPTKKKQTYTAKTFLFNLQLAYSHQAWLTVGWDNNAWRTCKILRDMDIKYARALRDALVSQGYCQEMSHIHTADKQLKAKLWVADDIFGVLVDTVDVVDVTANASILKDEDGNISEIVPLPTLEAWASLIKGKGVSLNTSSSNNSNNNTSNPVTHPSNTVTKINSLSTASECGENPFWTFQKNEVIPMDNFSFTHIRLHREAANHKMVDRGGRVYHPLLQMPKEYRAQMMLGGSPAAEVDICGSHVWQMYASVGINYQDKAYALDDISPEDVVFLKPLLKLIVMCLINCKPRGVALAVANEMAANPDTYSQYAGIDIRPLIAKLYARHAPIHNQLGVGRGFWCMANEGQLGLFLGEFFTKADKMLIPIHDGFMCDAADVVLLQDKIAEFWISRFGFAPMTKREF